MDGLFDPGLLPLPCFALGAREPEPVAPHEGARAPVARGQGTFFDEHVDMRDPEGTAFTARILEIYFATLPRRRRRGREALEKRLRALLANAMRAHFFRNPSAVLYFRGAASHWYADKPSWMKHGALADAVDVLEKAGLVESITGKLMPGWSKHTSWASSYAGTHELAQIATECGVSKELIGRRIPSDQLVRLSGPKPKREFDFNDGGLVDARKGKTIKFEPTAETQEWTVTLEAMNAFYRQQEIALGLSPNELVEWLVTRNADLDRVGERFRTPEMFQTDLYRVFNNGDEANPTFKQGGRLFGGWWMSLPSELRKAITINGLGTVELDYAACHPRMLYHKRGLDPVGELYALPEIVAYEAATGVPPDLYRPYVKWLMQVLINCRGRPAAVSKPEHIIMPPDFTAKQMIAFIANRHKPIASAFKTGAGLSLMRLESDIAFEIVSTAAAEGWTALPIHDSFVTSVDNQDRLRRMMIDSYVRRLGRAPVVR